MQPTFDSRIMMRHTIFVEVQSDELQNYKLQITIRIFGVKKTKILNIYLIFYNYIYIIIKYDLKIHFLAEKRAKMSYCNCNFVIL